MSDSLAYWRDHLAGAPLVLELPTDRPRSLVQSFTGARQQFVLSAQSWSSIARLCDAEDVTAFMTLFAVFGVLLHRYTGQDKILIGVPGASTDNTLAFAADLSGDPTFRDVLQQARSAVVGGFAHEDLPFDMLVEELDAARDLSRPPVVQVMFAFGRRAMRASKLELMLELAPEGMELAGSVEYNADLFDSSTIARFVGHFERLALGLVADPTARASEVPLLTPAERRQLDEWNATTCAFPDRRVEELFEQQALRTPDAVAVSFEGAHLTYRELDARANQLAHRLRELGVDRDVLVPLCVERSLEMLVGMLGILKAGGAYVPLDPGYPPERLASSLKDCEPRVVLTQARFVGQLPSASHVIALDTFDVTDAPRDKLTSVGTTTDLAYGIYTSGSTGTPKCVLVAHRGVVNLLFWLQATYPLDETDRVLQKTPITFDMAVEEVFWPFLVGARLVVARPDGHKDVAYLLDVIRVEKITTIDLVPSLLEILVNERGFADCVSLRRALAGGEALSYDLQARFFARSTAELHNLYGPTETTVTSSYWPCQRASTDRTIPIGRPIANTQLYIVDAHRQPVPIGVSGELYIGGVGLARGYLNRPELTNERFVPDPFTPGARLYRTGDVVRFRKDGAIEYLGRTDHQVKLRGFRIELGEIEACLREHPTIREAVVVMREDAPGHKRLVGYLVATQDDPPPETIVSHLRARLPEYMVPTDLVFLAAIPLTTNGKVDRKALPEPPTRTRAQPVIAPSSPTERLLAPIWKDLLVVDEVSRNDDFFELGGHSLTAMRIISRVRDQLGVELPLRGVFAGRTLAGIAREIDRIRGEATTESIGTVSREGDLPLSFEQQRLWFLHQLDPKSRAYNLPFAFRIRGPLDAEALRRAFETTIARHEALRTVFDMIAGEPRQRIVPAGPFALPVEDLGAHEAARRVEELADTVFDLAAGPLLIARLLRLAPDDHVLVLNVHHIVFDGWSVDVLWRELGNSYRGSAMPALPLQLADYAAWQRRSFTRARLDRTLAYWKVTLADAPTDLALPYRGPRPPMQTYRGGQVELVLAPELTAALRRLAQHHGSTLFTVIVAALRALIVRYTGQRDVCIGAAIANRGSRELEDLIGFFVNTAVLRGTVTPSDTFAALLSRETETALAAYAHDTPFNLVVDALGVERELNRVPLVQVMCVDQGKVEDLELSGLAIEPFAIELAPAIFDLTIETRERAGTREVIATYNVDLFERATITDFLARYERLLAGIAERPESPISQIDILDAGERAALLAESSAIAWGPPVPGVVEMIERRMVEQPDAPAMFWDGRAITYRELDDQTTRLGALLREHGVGPDRLVAVVADRGPALVVGLVGVLRAGGAYVPIKPDLPSDRIAWMLEESAPTVVLSDGPRGVLGTVVRLDMPESWPARGLAPRPAPHDALAYIAYTSGSTGRPKGAMVSRRALDAQLAGWRLPAWLGPDDRVLQLASVMFDWSVAEIFGSLAAGASLILVKPGGELDAAYLLRLANEQRATVIYFVPSLLRELVEAGTWRTITKMFSGGEELSIDLVRTTRAAFPRADIYNQYGPTETTIVVTSWHCQIDDVAIPIGIAVANTSLYVLDDQLAPVPPGGIGELYIGGIQLGRGYLRRPAMTAERFVPNPFGACPGERMYRTGDLVRRRSDGAFEYVGRTDTQVKLRGFRIELGEIESVLRQHPSIRRAAVVVRDDSSRGKVLVAYLCATKAVDTRAIRQFLAARLPHYMVPGAFVVLDELPLTATGKLDRRALPPPALEMHDAGGGPRTATEHVLVRIWCGVLGLPRVGIHDNFFACGGHSLLVMRLVVRINTELGVELRPRDVFECPTIAQQAERIDLATRVDTNAGSPAERELLDFVAALPDREVSERLADWKTVALDVQPSEQLAGERRALFERLLAQHQIDLHPTHPLARRDHPTAPSTWGQEIHYAFHERRNFLTLSVQATAFAVRGALDTNALQRAVGTLVERQPALRTTFRREHGRLLQTVQPRGCELELVDLAHLPPSAREVAVRAAFARLSAPHDLSRESFRASLVRTSAHEHLLFLSPNHIVFDGFSWDVLELELAALYRAFARGAEPAIPPLALHLNDFCFWQQTLEERPVGRAQLAFWAAAVAGYQGLELPLPGKPRGAVGLALDTAPSGTAPIAIEGDDWRAVEQCCARFTCAPYTILATAYFLMLTRWAGRPDVCAMTANFHRNRPGSEAVVGLFVTPYPLRVVFDEAATLEDAVRLAHATILTHRENNHVAPTTALGSWTEWSRYNLNYLIDLGAQPEDFGDVTVERLDWSAVETRTAHDLALFVRQGMSGIRGVMAFNADRFPPDLVARAVTRVCQILRAIASAPTTRIRDLPRAVE